MNAHPTSGLRFAMMALATAWIGLGQAAEPGTSGTLITQPEFLGGQVKLNWNSGGLLEAAPSPAGPWAAIDAPTLRQSAATIPVVPGHKFFRVVDNGVPTAAMPLVNSDPSRPFKIAKGFLRKAATDNGNAVIEAELEAGQNPPSVFPLLQDERVLVFRDDGQAGDAAAGDGTFTAPLFIDENDFIAAKPRAASCRRCSTSRPFSRASASRCIRRPSTAAGSFPTSAAAARTARSTAPPRAGPRRPW
jgi:hypothetical protein